MSFPDHLRQDIDLVMHQILTLNESIKASTVQREFTFARYSKAVDSGWTMSACFMIFFMQCGFAFLEAGSVRNFNASYVILKNFCDFAVGTLFFWMFGYALYRGVDGRFIGGNVGSQYMLDSDEYALDFIMFNAFANTTVTIVSGAVAGRFKFVPYLISCAIMVTCTWPVVAHWAWTEGGWLRELGYLDFAGSSIVHAVGGISALMGAAIVGSRADRFVVGPNGKKINNIEGSSVMLIALGSLILWFGWYGFNAGSTLGISNGKYLVSARCALNTTLAGASGILTMAVISKTMEDRFNFIEIVNGLLVSLVGITAGCATVTSWGAIITGILCVGVYRLSSALLIRLEVDDVVNAFPVHGAGGIFGTLLTAIFSKQEYIDKAYGKGYCNYNVGHQLGIQLLGIVAISAWVICTLLPIYVLIEFTVGTRVSEKDEFIGLDFKYHKGYSFKTFAERTAEAKKQMERERLMGQYLGYDEEESSRTKSINKSKSVSSVTTSTPKGIRGLRPSLVTRV